MPFWFGCELFKREPCPERGLVMNHWSDWNRGIGQSCSLSFLQKSTVGYTLAVDLSKGKRECWLTVCGIGPVSSPGLLCYTWYTTDTERWRKHYYLKTSLKQNRGGRGKKKPNKQEKEQRILSKGRQRGWPVFCWKKERNRIMTWAELSFQFFILRLFWSFKERGHQA